MLELLTSLVCVEHSLCGRHQLFQWRRSKVHVVEYLNSGVGAIIHIGGETSKN